MLDYLTPESSRSVKAHHMHPPREQAHASRHHAFSKERKEQRAPGGRVTSSQLAQCVKSSGSKPPTSIGQKYIGERARWRARKALHEQDRRVYAKRSANLGVGVVSISGAQIACLQARMPIDLGESAVGSVGGSGKLFPRRIAYFDIFGLDIEMVGLVLSARDSLVACCHVCWCERNLRIRHFYIYILLAQN